MGKLYTTQRKRNYQFTNNLWHHADDIKLPVCFNSECQTGWQCLPITHDHHQGCGARLQVHYELTFWIIIGFHQPPLWIWCCQWHRTHCRLSWGKPVLTHHGLKQLLNPSVGLKTSIDVCRLSKKRKYAETRGVLLIQRWSAHPTHPVVPDGKSVELLIKDFSAAAGET